MKIKEIINVMPQVSESLGSLSRNLSHHLRSRTHVFGVGIEPLERDAVLAHEDHGGLVIDRGLEGTVEAQGHGEITGVGAELYDEVSKKYRADGEDDPQEMERN